ncbi:phosphoglycerate kinase [Patescibacteria group bacterium]|nr:phosphoglycerate kinase [Patescibacteria group bacterium]
MKFNSISKSANLKDKCILMRVDLNLPMQNGRIQKGATQRIDRVAPEIIKMTRRGAKVILMTHLGRPNGKKISNYSCRHLVRSISEKIGQGVAFVPHHFGPVVENEISHLKRGGVLLIENLRFDSGEEKDSAAFAKGLASLGDFYVNNAFSVSHRKHASVHAVTKYIQSYAGDLLIEEVEELSKPLKNPLVLVIGGAKISTKIGLINKMGKSAEHILVGGGMACVLQAAKTGNWDSVRLLDVDSGDKKHANSLLKRFGKKLILPPDVQIKSSLKSRAIHVSPSDAMPKDTIPVDIGPKTIAVFKDYLKDAGSVVWNGPLGIIELSEARKGTRQIARSMAGLKNARTIVGGGDILQMLCTLNIEKKLSYISTGGGAMLALLSGEKLPGLIPLQK